MKPTFSFLLFFCFLLSSHAQSKESYYIFGVPLDSIKSPYIEAEVCRVPFTTKVFIDIDYGQESKVLYNKYNRVADEKGNYIEFKSNMDAINFLINIGYELFNAENIRMNDDDIRSKYILKKKIKNP